MIGRKKREMSKKMEIIKRIFSIISTLVTTILFKNKVDKK